MKKIFYLLIISLLIVTGCGKSKESANNTNKVIKDIEVESSEILSVNEPQLIERNDNKIIRAEIRPTGTEKFNQINIKIYAENDELIKELSFQIDEEIYKGQVFIIEEDYTYEEKEPYKIVVESELIENDVDVDSSINDDQIFVEDATTIENE